MNRKRLLPVGIFIAVIITLNSCNDSSEEADPCLNSPEISIDNVMISIKGKSTGEIVLSATGGSSPHMFSIDGTNFQSNGTFSNIPADDYTVVVKDANDCTVSEMVTVDEIEEVFYANQIRPIIDLNCQISNCHGSNSNIPSWATYNDIKARASGIKVRTGNGTMPPNGSLSDSDIKLIADWVDQGAPEN